MNELNKDSHTTLNSNVKNTGNKRTYLKILSRDWDVHNRNELLETLAAQENDGHAVSFARLQQIIKENNNDIQMILEKNRFSSRDDNRIRFISEHWRIYQDAHIEAWDWGRNIALCRWGFDVGFLTEEEAWDKIMYYAEKIQPLYESWEDYGLNYCWGRIYWASGFGLARAYENMEQTEKLYKRLMEDPGYWHNLKWDIKLQ
jgi:hypothetical protein